MEILFLASGLVLGGIIAFLITKQMIKTKSGDSGEINRMTQEMQELQINVKTEEDKYIRSEKDLLVAKENLALKEEELLKHNSQLAISNTQLLEEQKDRLKAEQTLEEQSLITKQLEEAYNQSKTQIAELKVALKGVEKELKITLDKLSTETSELAKKTTEYHTANEELATLKANNNSLQEKLETQKKEIEDLGKKFNLEFQAIANKILEEKTQKFTNVNKESLETILKPLGENLDKFKKQVEETYDKEAKERFSLGEQVKEMAQLNKIISDEARNLTTALKGEAKTQGNWGEMILENILEKSGLRKDEEYRMEYQLEDEEGNPLRSEEENKKMRPDAVIQYPDNRSVIIDSKVSLNAFTRYIAATDKQTQDMELQAHVSAIKNHIISLSTKAYDDYNKSLDFVMMFVPSEPAYIAAMQGDSNLWNFAYDKRILLMNPTNLITSLKLIVDLWKREYQNQNAIEIASRGAKLYDKFVGFVKNLDDVGSHIEKAQGKYNEAYKQLSTGNDNLVLQATKLKDLGIKNKKEIDKNLEQKALEQAATEKL